MLIFEAVKAELSGSSLNVRRAKIPGGWLVMVITAPGIVGSPSITFVPDTDHKWDGSSLPR